MLGTKYNFGFLLLLFIFIFNVSFAQKPENIEALTDKQIEEYYKAALEKGLTEEQMEKLALANGYKAEDIVKIRERYNKIKSKSRTAISTAKKSSREQLGNLSKRAFIDDLDSLGRRQSKSDSLLYKKEKNHLNKKEIFGAYLFQNKQLSFEPNLRLATPSNYILGPDDELSVDISGYAFQHYSLVISPEGTVKIENLAPIYVNGLSVQKAKEKIEQRLRPLFAGLRNGTLNLDVTLGDVRSIKVTLIGEIKSPGTYTVSSLSTLFNALYLSGGPSENGSFRSIQLLRGNKIVQRLDLYDFLMKGSAQGNVSLQDQDVIFIPVAERKVVLDGEIKRKMIFELKPEETVDDVLKFAGGFTEKAYVSNLNVNRKTAKEKKLITVDQSQFEHFALNNGDSLSIGAIIDRFENKVSVEGAIFRPGDYAISGELSTVSQLIKKAEGLREDAFLNRAILRRLRENLDPEFIGIDLGKLLKGEIPDIALKREDALIIKSILEIRELRNVTIHGAVTEPGDYRFVENMTVNDLIILSGGFREGATGKRIEIARRLFNDELVDKTVEVINLEITKDLLTNAKLTVLRPFDQVFVRELPNYQTQKLVSIEGEVNYPGKYTIQNRTERIYDLIVRAGGLRPESYLQGAKFFRDKKIVAVNLKEVVENPKSINNLFLEEADSLVIPKNVEIITISGEVLNPTSVAYQPDFSFKNYIAQAGGFSDSAFVKKTYVRYANGLTDRTSSFLGIKKYPKVERGMEIIVPTKRRQKMSKAEIISMSTGFVSLSAVLLTLFNLVKK
jgi:polysaccharide export outer membrane protein